MKDLSAKTSSSFSWAAFQSHIRYLGTEDQKKIREAFELGATMHDGQLRKSGEPYFTHPIAVAHILADMGGDADTIIAALLHDALEDTELSEDEIEERFGKNVRRMIDALTKLDDADLSERPTLTGQIETIRKLFTFMQEDVRIMVIKLVDRLHNMQTVEFLPEEKRRALAQETQDVYVKIADRLSLQDLRDELAELCHGVLEPEVLQGMLRIRSESERRAERVIGEMKKAIALVRESVPIELVYEPSRFRKLRKLYEAGGSTVTGVAPFSIAFVCADIATCYQTLGALHQCWRREVLSFQDFINAPMINGYQGLHTTMILEDGTRVRCKIRTREMNAYARSGIATKCFGGRPMGLPSYLGWSKRISPLAEGTSERSDDFWESLQSDILGESIMVYGPGDQAMLLPEGATVLDSAFYFLGDQALRVKSMRMDGKEVALQTLVTNAATVEVDLARKRVVDRTWLTWVSTGLSQTKIREALGAEPREKKVEEGRRLLEMVILEKKKGLLAEFSEKSLQMNMNSIGFSSLEDGYVAIAEGRVAAAAVARSLFEKNATGVPELQKNRAYNLKFMVKKDDFATLNRLVNVYAKHYANIRGIRIHPFSISGMRRFRMIARMSIDEAELLKEEVVAAGGFHVQLFHSASSVFPTIALPVLSILWGLDCLLGKKLVLAGVSPFDLTFLRFSVLFFMSFTYLVFVRLLASSTSVRFKKLSPFNVYLFISGGAIFATALTSYIAIQTISVLTYALCMNIGVVGAFAYRNARSPSRSIPFLITSIGFILTTFVLLFLDTQSLLSLPALASIGCGVFFALYSISSGKYQEQESVRSRYPEFICYFSFLALILSSFFVLESGFSLAYSPLLPPSIAFVTFLTALPYIIYFELLKYHGGQVAGRYIPLFLLVIFAGDILLYGTKGPVLLVPIIFAAAWAYWYKDVELLPTGAQD
ncbi:MAG TPA: HD domain-containing protein [Candidatus Peribacterales bacterium]|nr:HD domain-containing protein [Candidatus Peribacterales bacterium]